MALMTWPISSDGAGAVTYTANEWRTIVTALFSEGILGLGSFEVTQRGAGANMTLDIAAGVAVLEGDDAANQGRYLVREATADTEAVTIGTADPSNPRIDLVGIQLNDPSEGGAAGRNCVFTVVAGAAAVTPAAPATPDSFLVLASVAVAAAATSIVDANITDARTIARLANEVVGTAAIDNDAVTTVKINDDAVTNAKIGANAVTATQINDGSVTTSKIADSGVTTVKINDAAVTTGKLSTTTSGGTLASGAIVYRKFGAMVFVWTTSAPASASPLASLPVGFRPISDLSQQFIRSGGLVGTLTITTTGTISSTSSESVLFSVSFVTAA